MIYLTFLLIPIIISITSLILFKRISLKEFLIQTAAVAVLMGLFVTAIKYRNQYDLETINGQVTSKERKRTSCEHSYSCNCHTSCSGSGKNRSCHTVCQTCHEHSYDVNWVVHSDIDSLKIKRIDRQGLNEPPRWTEVQINEPFSVEHSYTNYIKGNPNSLFRQDSLVEKYKKALISYPNKIYDYYRIDRLVELGEFNINPSYVNKKLSEMNRDLNPSKQVNVILILTKNYPQDYALALEQHWLGGKKNDAIAVVNLDSDNNVTWSYIISLSNEEFKISLRNAILNMGSLDIDKLLNTMFTVTRDTFQRRSMKEFEYLNATVQPSKGEWIVGMILGFLLSIGLSILFYYFDLDNGVWESDKKRWGAYR